MQVIKSIEKMAAFSKKAIAQNKVLGFVPTMGYLHEGHLSLVKKAKKECDLVIISIFVNPAQFGPKEDLAAYPRDFRRDLKLLGPLKPDVVFKPDPSAVYPGDYHTYVQIEGGLTKKLCGSFRPAHFKGVTTIVAKLFNIVRPDKAYFGQKDAQQCVVIKKMVKDLNFPVEVIALPTVREKDGLALSSRNTYLTPEERKKAPVLYKTLRLAEKMILTGERNCAKVEQAMKKNLALVKGLEIQYAVVVDAGSLERKKIVSGNVLLALAVKLGATRLIDNIIMEL